MYQQLIGMHKNFENKVFWLVRNDLHEKPHKFMDIGHAIVHHYFNDSLTRTTMGFMLHGWHILPVCVCIYQSAAVNSTPMTNAANAMPTTVPESRPSTLTTRSHLSLLPSDESTAAVGPASASTGGVDWPAVGGMRG